MEYIIIVIIILAIVVFEELHVQKELRENLKSKNDRINKLRSEVIDKEKAIKLLIQDNKNLKKQNAIIQNELKNFTEIKNDSLNLNVIDEEISKSINNLMDDFDLNEEKKEIINIIENSNNNMFITGKAGTGKSYLLKAFRARTKKKVLYCAPTGIAALNINAVTLHSAFGYKNLMDDNEIKLSANRLALLKSIDTLVIDEISMVRADVFSQIDKILKISNKNNQPFGGKQLLLFGDLFQLPPVADREVTEYLNNKYGGIFFFNSPAYEEGNFKFRELETIFRQEDQEFIDILNDIRIGNINEKQIKSLNEHYVKEAPRRVVQIVPMKNEANKINLENIEKLGGNEFNYQANILVGGKDLKETDFPCDFNLKLKVGSLVMMITNDQENKRWVNGTLGIVSGLLSNMIKVTIDGVEYEISPVTFNKLKCEYDKEEQKLKYIVESSVSQYPLILSYAITIHKSQGMTYQQIACNLENCFAPGQAYVALSRCANYDKLFLTEKINAGSIIINNSVINFYNKCKNK